MTRPREKIWIVRAGDGATVGEIVRRAGEDPTRALADGRVFVGKRRVSDANAKVNVGDTVRIGAPRPAPPLAPEKTGSRILFEDRGVLATIKEAGVPTVPDHASASNSHVARVAAEIGRDAASLHVTSRLDRDVSGVVLFALDERARDRLARARETGDYVRRYLAIAKCRRATLPVEGLWDAPIGRAECSRLRAAGGPDAKPSRTRFRVVARVASSGGSDEVVLLAVFPETGRTHQIRVHASHAGAPLLGDRDYGGAVRLVGSNGSVVALGRIALHCARVEVAPLVAEAPVPEPLRRAWAELGGAPEAWNTALTCGVPGVSSSS